MKKQQRNCIYCGTEFTAMKETSVHCVKHAYRQSPAYIALRKTTTTLTDEQKKEHKRICNVNYRLKHKSVKKPKEPKEKKKKITSAIIMPTMVAAVAVPVVAPVSRCFVQVDRRTRIEFQSEERRERWLKRNVMA